MIAFGLTPAEFRQRHFEHQPLLAKRALREPFPWSELDAALHQIEPTAPIVRLVNGGPISEERYTDLVVELGAPRRRLNQRRFYAELRGGATLVINGFENHSPRSLRLCAELGRFTGWRTVGNAYLSVGGRGTFGRHWDTHDVFAIQLIGCKRWLVYPPTLPLPLGMHPSEGSGHSCPTTPAIDCVLEARDVLYVPRGWWHQAIPFDEPSLHLSVGTYGPTVHDYLTWVCGRHLPAALAARRSLTSAVGRSDIEAAVQAFRDLALADATRAEFERGVASSERLRSTFDTELLLSSGAAGLKPDTLVSLVSRQPIDVGCDEIAVNGGRLRLHPLSRAIVAELAGAQLTIEELCRRLSAERPDALRAAVLDLAEHEVVTIVRPKG
jgi:ribosomal protein L16 Arg81 hydroxylase